MPRNELKYPHRLLKRRLLQLAGGGLTDMGNALTSLPEVKFAQEVHRYIGTALQSIGVLVCLN